MEWTDPSEFAREAEEHQRVELSYESVYSDSVQTVEGNVREAGEPRWNRVISDSGSDYTIYAKGLHMYEPGVLVKNGREIGEFVSAEPI